MESGRRQQSAVDARQALGDCLVITFESLGVRLRVEEGTDQCQ